MMPSGQFNIAVISVSDILPLDKGHYISGGWLLSTYGRNPSRRNAGKRSEYDKRGSEQTEPRILLGQGTCD